MLCEYESSNQYIASANTIKEKIIAIDKVIDALLLISITVAENSDTDEYWIDDGQTKIKQMYNDPVKIAQAIDAYRKIRIHYENRLNGRITKLTNC